MQAPFGLISGTVDRTAIFERWPGLAGHGHDLHRAVHDLGHLEGEQLAHEVRVRAAQRDDRAAHAAVDADDVAADALAVPVGLARHLLGRRQHALGLAVVQGDDHDPAGVGPGVALHLPVDDLALLGGELAVGAVVLGVAQAGQDHLAGRGGGDAAEALGGVVPLAHRLAVGAALLGHHADQAGLAVDVDARVRLVAVGVLVGGEQGGLDGAQHGVEGDVLVALDGAQGGDVDVHRASSVSLAGVPPSSTTSASGGGRNSTCTAACATSA
jgi:hypothetical protein